MALRRMLGCCRAAILSLVAGTAFAAPSVPALSASPGGAGALPVEIHTVAPFDAVVLPMRGSYSQHVAALARLQSELHRLGVTPSGPPFGRYISDSAQTPEANLLWEVGFPVAANVKPSPPFVLRHYETRLVASLRVHGPYAENSLRWPAFYEWLAGNGYQAVDSSMESWSVFSTPDGFSTGESELQVPVRRIAIFSSLVRYVICLWGVCVFAMFSWFHLMRSRRHKPSLWAGPLWALLCLACVVLYLQPLVSEFIYLYGAIAFLPFHGWSTAIAGIMIPPLLVHLFFRITRDKLPVAVVFRWAVAIMYAGSVIFVASLRYALQFWLVPDRALHIANGFIALSAVICLAMVLLARSNQKSHSMTEEHWVYTVLLSVMVAASLTGVMVGSEASRELSDSVLRVLPTLFLLAATYYNERAVFVDRIAKRGLFLLAALILLTLYFALVPPLLFSPRLGWVGMWIFPFSMLPMIALAPWAYGRISSLLDRYWLGRSLPPAAAHQFFLHGLGTAATEEDLVHAAEERLGSIYPSSFRVVLGGEHALRDEDTTFDAAITAHGAHLGVVQMETMPGGRPFLSEDRAQLASLADSFGLVLENFRLREKRLQQETRERELRLHASRAELRALRAQINPHFLFNALNSIAALISEDPEQAEATVERLSELFRYTLRNWDGEWVRVDQELAFVRCYLDIEKTRFGSRLNVSVHHDKELGEAFVPALVVQTLVENAVKHGVAPRREPGSIEIRITRKDNTLRVDVRDSGSGFPVDGSGVYAAGHGLKNVQDRLRGHFGDDAQLLIERDEEDEMTEVSIVMPLVLTPPAELQAVS